MSLVLPAQNVFAGRGGGQEKIVVLSQSESVNRTYFTSGDSVTISGTINADAYIAGGNVIIDGVINGDLIAAGGVVNISGTVTNDIRVAGGQITISGQVGRNITAAGGNVSITPESQVNGSVVMLGGNTALSTPLRSDATFVAATTTIDSTIEGDVNAVVGQLNLTPGSSVRGNLLYVSENTLQETTKRQVSGQIVEQQPKKMTGEEEATKRDWGYAEKPKKVLGFISGLALGITFFMLISSFIVGLLLIRFLPVYMTKTQTTMEKKPWPVLGFGFVALIVTPVAGFILLGTVIGLPLGVFAFMVYGVAMYMAHIVVALFAGRKVLEWFKTKTSNIWELLVGLVVLSLIGIIPIIGNLVSFLVTITGLGAIAITEKEKYDEMREKKLI